MPVSVVTETWVACEEQVCEGYACPHCGVLYTSDGAREHEFHCLAADRHLRSAAHASRSGHRLVPVQRG